MMWIWPIFLFNLAFSQDLSSERYCFASLSLRESAARQVQGILLPVDKLTTDQLCFTISTKPHRRELIQNYLRRVQPDVQIASSTDEQKKEPCRLKIEKEKNQLADQTIATTDPNPYAATTSTEAQQKETMQIQTMGDFELKYLQESIQGNCRLVTPERYIVRIEVRKDPVPVLTNLAPQPDQQTSKLVTQVELRKGERIDLGGIVMNLRNQNGEINSTPVAEYSQGQKSQDEKVYLSID
jgi:hypothetical protein